MKNTYIIALKDKELCEPIFIKMKPHNDISYIWRIYYRAYIFETKEQAEKTRRDWYKTYEEKKKEKEEIWYKKLENVLTKTLNKLAEEDWFFN